MIARIALKASYLLLLLFICTQVNAQLKADFNSVTNTGCSPLLVQFNDLSSGTPSEWEWDLGNGTSSFLQNPSVTYFEPGSYNVTLIIKKNGINDTITKPNYVKVYGNPIVDFFANITSGCFPLNVKFTDKSIPVSGTIVKWEWDFGDGINSNDPNPQHLYTTSGNYNITLRITTSNGCVTTISKASFIKISNGVLANFTNNNPSLCTLPVSFNFQNLSTGSGTLSYTWNFGDGTSSTEKTPIHNYTTAGIYTVSLNVQSSTGCSDKIIKDSLINIGKLKSSFSADSLICFENTVTFTNTSTPSPISVLWNFGDGTTSTQKNPVKSYSGTGTYDVKLISNFGACKDSSFKKITVLSKPKATYFADNTSSCKVPFTVNFTNQSTNADSFKWYFGDGDSSISLSPSHTYNTEGNYTVTMIANNTNDCSDTVVFLSYIKIILPKIQLLNVPDSGCIPFTKQLSYSSNIPLFNLIWDLGDGNISHDASPLYTYVNPGKYTVSLTGTTNEGCTATKTMKDAVIASIKPQSHFSATPRETCAEFKVVFTDESTGGATNWLWTFGDGSTSTLQNPEHYYTDTGYFDIQLIVWNFGCPDTLVIPKYIHITAPIARFSYEGDCKNPFEKKFTDKSIAADKWNWDFGDGTSSTVQNPVHTFSLQGTFPVTLTVYNNQTGCKYSYFQQVPVAAVNANFYASDTFVCKNNSVAFTVPAANKTNITNYEWELGDGIIRTSNGGLISFSYPSAGVYDVKLIVTDILGCIDTLTKPQYIHVFGPTSKFTSLVKGSCLNSAVNFLDQSVNDGIHLIKTLIWDFGDGRTDTFTISGNNVPPSLPDTIKHIYTVSGIYTISLQSIDSIGCMDTYSIPEPLVISQPASDFFTDDTISCPNKPVVFTNFSTGTGLTYNWNFGDNLSSTQKGPTHSYSQEGLYTVMLAVKDKYGCTDTTIKPDYIRILISKADFRLSDSFSTCPPLIVNFSDQSINAISMKWDFGDKTFSTINNPSHFYTTPGTYIVKQTITGPGGCVDVKQKSIIIRGPIGSFTYSPTSGCMPLKVNFKATTQDKVSFIWDFSDGATISTIDSLPAHTYNFYGEYLPKMILVDSTGCKVAITGTDTVKTFGASANFNMDKNIFCDSAIVSFKDSSAGHDKITGYKWIFGDGTIASIQNVVHTYTQTGTYFSRLIITTENGCIDSTSGSSPIKISTSPQIDIANFLNGCTPLYQSFKGLILLPDTSSLQWNWSLGNGSNSSLQNPATQIYTVAGKYNLDLTVTNSSGCFDTLHRNFEVYPAPDVSAGIDTMVCNGKNIQLNATGASSYIWKNMPGMSCFNCAAPTVSPVVDTRYFVIGKSLLGCTDTASVLVKVRNPLKMQVSNTDTICKGDAVKISATGADTYIWSPKSGIDNISSGTPVVSPDTTTLYQVIGKDERNCFADTGYVKINVFPMPTVYAGEDKIISVGQSIKFDPVISNDVTVVEWTPSTGIIDHSPANGITVKPKENTEYTIAVKNPGGCTAQDKVVVYVICNNANIYMPNTFSPNKDGMNEIYYPRGTGIFTIKTFRIFDRWGELVFEKANFNANEKSSGWDGKYKNRELNPDVYVYILEVICENNFPLTFKGNVTLIK